MSGESGIRGDLKRQRPAFTWRTPEITWSEDTCVFCSSFFQLQTENQSLPYSFRSFFFFLNVQDYDLLDGRIKQWNVDHTAACGRMDRNSPVKFYLLCSLSSSAFKRSVLKTMKYSSHARKICSLKWRVRSCSHFLFVIKEVRIDNMENSPLLHNSSWEITMFGPLLVKNHECRDHYGWPSLYLLQLWHKGLPKWIHGKSLLV